MLRTMGLAKRMLWMVPVLAILGSFGAAASSWSFPSPLVSLFKSWFLYPKATPTTAPPQEGTSEGTVTPVEEATPGEGPEVSIPSSASRRDRWGMAGKGETEPLDEGTCISDLQERIVMQATRTRIIIDEFKDEYTRHNYNMTWDDVNAHFPDVDSDRAFLMACNEEQECLSVLPSLPPTPPQPPTDDEGSQRILKELSGYCRQYCEALSLIFLDESLFEERFQEDLDTAQRNMESLTNILVKGVDLCDGSPDNDLVKKMVDMMYKREDQDMRHRRGFATLRQCLLGLRFIIDVFSPET
ncbi:uncharacterized protein LOC122243809 [Penaeus japonicus]|uniref:uncharacterized protein LOC122243809 n=1 Tax=Penaeus japonicus TaxID=27405 RepID=UPI001C70D6AE|nr:uncharacterized protein LOC122243809 [Penaeus japonicus]